MTEILVANKSHVKYAETVCSLMYESALKRGTGIAKRSPEYIAKKMEEGKAIVAIDGDRLIGFSYIESWQHKRFVANSGLIVDPEYRNTGLARKIKRAIFDLSRRLYPDAKIFSITTGLAVMKLNSELGYVPVTFSELTDDDDFWKGCEGCRNYHILQENNRRMCLCTGMLYDPEKHKAATETENPEADRDVNAVREMIPEKVLSPKRIAQLRKNLRKIHLI
ncbi:MAG: GNAT family N-acetyltransferase [Prevotellaceae bacterium]|jgi:GNAT superfamily N-acetyltransferase|nr:GNAT family N-acetyltransferase [Prevotellaceae bacterium]